MSGDLPGGGYPLSYTFRKAVGLAANATQSDLTVRSNLEFTFLGNLTDAAASLVTGKATVIPVPVGGGDVITKVTIAPGATPESGGSHAWVAIYSGVLTTAALQGAQSVDATGAAVIAAAPLAYTFTLGSAVLITPANAPYGYIYVALSVTGTVPSLSSAACAAAVQYARFTNAPPFWAGTYGSALGAVAPATITLASVAAIATVPEVYLS